jgi:hypothetical protein
MLELNLVLYIGDNNLVAQVEGDSFVADALDIKEPLRIKSLGKINVDLLIGTWVSDVITATELLRWNTYSVSFSSSDTIPEVGINAFFPSDNIVLVQAGLSGNIYAYNGSELELYKNIPGEYTPTSYAYVHPSSVGNMSGQVLFGMSNGAGNPCDMGVYRMARHDTKYPFIFDMPYPISERSGTSRVTTSIEIGGIAVSGFNIYVAWKNGTTYGIDKVDYTTKLDGAYFETRVMSLGRELLSTVGSVSMSYYQIPANCDLTIQYDKNYAGFTSMSTTVDTGRLSVSSEEGIEASTVAIKVTFGTDSNNAPSIEHGVITLR